MLPTAADLDNAWDFYDRGDAEAQASLTKISFVVMRRLGLTEAFTNDRHFHAAGFTTLF